MTGLTKTQINYLENKLDRVINDKVEKFKKELGEGNSSDRVLLNEIVAGKIKLLPKSELIKRLEEKANCHRRYYDIALYVNEMVLQEDKERIEKEFNERETKTNEFRERLNKAKQNALDNIVLNGVDVETALAELDNIK